MTKRPSTPVARARQLRKAMTPQEIRLWLRLRALRPQGLHFRRQAPVDGYILDFVCFRSRLIVECDGSQHGLPENQSRDAMRDSHFTSAGFLTLRFWNHEIDDNLSGVADSVFAQSQPRIAL